MSANIAQTWQVPDQDPQDEADLQCMKDTHEEGLYHEKEEVHHQTVCPLPFPTAPGHQQDLHQHLLGLIYLCLNVALTDLAFQIIPYHGQVQ